MATERSMTSGDAGLVTVRADVAPGKVRWNAARLRMAAMVFSADRNELLAFGRRVYLGAVVLASAIFCVLFVLVFVLKPLRNLEVVRVVLPPTRTVILKEVVPEPPAPAEAEKPDLKQLNVQKVNDPPVTETVAPPPPRIEPTRPIDPVAERSGRARAREATSALNQATASLDKALGDLASALGSSSTGSYQPTRRVRDRNVRSGRSDGQLGAVGNGSAGSGAAADLAGSKVEGSLVSIGSLAPAPASQDRGGANEGTSSGPRPGTGRSNASLLAVIQRYAAGIQYCYESELKRDPSLRGKLVVAMTVTASGNVAEAAVVRNTVGSDRLESCALSQIRSWKFPSISGGLTTFQAPFVFTPPK